MDFASDILTAAGILLGFEVTALWWRVQREVAIAKPDIPTRICPADYLNLAAMVTIGTGIFLVPLRGNASAIPPQFAVGLSSILFIGHAFALVGHYGLFNPDTARSGSFFPLQEKIAVGFTVAIAVVYILMAVQLL